MRCELPHLIDLAGRLLELKEPGVLATLFSSRGSSYRSLGSMMVGGPPSVLVGSVSGGCLEEYIVRHGREVTRDHSAALLSFDTGSAEDVDEPKPVLGCGGSIDVLVERLTRNHLEHLRRMAIAYADDVASLTTCTVEPTGNGGGVSVTRRWWQPGDDDRLSVLARQALCDRRSYCGSTGGAMSGRTLVHYVPPLTRLILFGGLKDVRPVCDLGRALGWHVTVADRRARRARAAHFPSADVVIAAPWEAAVEQIRFTAKTAVVLMTHSLPDDLILLPLLADKPFTYAGVLGPAHRRDALLALLTEECPTINEDFVARLRGPLGLDLGDRSAVGIAVSVISEILARLNDRDALPLSNAVRASRGRTPNLANA